MKGLHQNNDVTPFYLHRICAQNLRDKTSKIAVLYN